MDQLLDTAVSLGGLCDHPQLCSLCHHAGEPPDCTVAGWLLIWGGSLPMCILSSSASAALHEFDLFCCNSRDIQSVPEFALSLSDSLAVPTGQRTRQHLHLLHTIWRHHLIPEHLLCLGIRQVSHQPAFVQAHLAALSCGIGLRQCCQRCLTELRADLSAWPNVKVQPDLSALHLTCMFPDSDLSGHQPRHPSPALQDFASTGAMAINAQSCLQGGAQSICRGGCDQGECGQQPAQKLQGQPLGHGCHSSGTAGGLSMAAHMLQHESCCKCKVVHW